MSTALALLLSFLAGSLLAGPSLARLRGVDLYSVGSGNPGATNVERMLGRSDALLVLALDAGKAAAAVVLTRELVGADFTGFSAFAVVVGHCAPAWAFTRGGRGVAPALGAICALEPRAGVLFVMAYVITRRISGYGSVASLIGLVVGLVATTSLAGFDASTSPLFFVVLLVFARHRENLRRLATGTEPRVGSRVESDRG